jgi:acyl transferase domain-containing protein
MTGALESMAAKTVPSSRGRWLLGLSAADPAGVESAAASLGRMLRRQPDEPLAALAGSLARRPAQRHRIAVVASTAAEAADLLLDHELAGAVRGDAGPAGRPAVFIFPGVGDHYPGMVSGLYRRARAFRLALDACAERFRIELGSDIRDLLGLDPEGREDGRRARSGRVDLSFRLRSANQIPEQDAELDRPRVSQPMLFAVEYALAQLLAEVGLSAAAVLGYSVGECVAMCLAGILGQERAAEFVAGRAAAIEATRPGCMTAVLAGEGRLREILAGLGEPDLSIAAVLGSHMCVASGSEPAVARLERVLTGDGVAVSRLPVRHAFHSPLMDDATEPVADLAARLGLAAPHLPILSNVTGDWLSPLQATDPRYWAEQARSTVRFTDNLARAWSLGRPVMIEVGPGRTLSTFARTHPDARADGIVVSLLSPARPAQRGGPDTVPADADVDAVLQALAVAWASGLPVDLDAVRDAITPGCGDVRPGPADERGL